MAAQERFPSSAAAPQSRAETAAVESGAAQGHTLLRPISRWETEVSEPTSHLPVAFESLWGRETGRYAEAQRIPSSRTLLVQFGPHFVCISSVFFAVCGSGRQRGRLMLNHVRTLLPAQCLPRGTA